MVWEFADVLGRRLVAWGLLSIVLALPMLAAGDAFWSGLGAMFVAWGAVDAAIGVVARPLAERNRRRTIGDPPARARDARRLRRILLVNAGLDILYIALGAWLLATAGDDAWRAGAGWGVVLQGAFLLGFDVLHAAWVPMAGAVLPDGVDLFPGPGHEAFRLVREPGGTADEDGPRAVRGALLVHGFAGSPKELRGLAAVLAADGWLVEVPLLPGHGAAFREVADYRVEDWVRTVEAAAADLRAAGATSLLVAGHSVGGALGLATAATVRPDALVLLAPFAWTLPAWQRVVGRLLRVGLPPGFRVFSRLDLADPEVRRGIEALLPGADLDDPAVVTGLRQVQVPVSLLEQLFRVAALADAAAPHVRVPVQAVQGLQDSVSRPERTRTLLARLPSPPVVVELEAGHDLVSEASTVRDEVLREILRFTRALPPG